MIPPNCRRRLATRPTKPKIARKLQRDHSLGLASKWTITIALELFKLHSAAWSSTVTSVKVSSSAFSHHDSPAQVSSFTILTKYSGKTLYNNIGRLLTREVPKSTIHKYCCLMIARILWETHGSRQTTFCIQRGEQTKEEFHPNLMEDDLTQNASRSIKREPKHFLCLFTEGMTVTCTSS